MEFGYILSKNMEQNWIFDCSTLSKCHKIEKKQDVPIENPFNCAIGYKLGEKMLWEKMRDELDYFYIYRMRRFSLFEGLIFFRQGAICCFQNRSFSNLFGPSIQIYNRQISQTRKLRIQCQRKRVIFFRFWTLGE